MSIIFWKSLPGTAMADRTALTSTFTNKITVAIFDDADFVTQHERLLRDERDIQVVGNEQSPMRFSMLVAQRNPDVALIDVMASGDPEEVLEMIAAIKAVKPRVRCLVYTVSLEREYFRQALQHHVEGYFTRAKAGSERYKLSELIRLVHRSAGFYEPEFVSWLATEGSHEMPRLYERSIISYAPRLTPREKDILEMVWYFPEATNWQIGQLLDVEVDDIKKFLRGLYDKFGCKGKTALVKRICDYGGIDHLLVTARRAHSD